MAPEDALLVAQRQPLIILIDECLGLAGAAPRCWRWVKDSSSASVQHGRQSSRLAQQFIDTIFKSHHAS